MPEGGEVRSETWRHPCRASDHARQSNASSSSNLRKNRFGRPLTHDLLTGRLFGTHIFNSATAVMPWVTSSRSMAATPVRRFNSATAVMPWVTAAPVPEIITGGKLQFGHGGDAVGDQMVRLQKRSLIRLQFGHGGDAVGDLAASHDASTSERLQFGHGGDAVGDVVLPPIDGRVRHASIRPRR